MHGLVRHLLRPSGNALLDYAYPGQHDVAYMPVSM